MHYERGLTIDEKYFGLDNPNIASDVNILDLLRKVLGDPISAQTLLERALKILRQTLGDDHPHTMTVKRILEVVREQMVD